MAIGSGNFNSNSENGNSKKIYENTYYSRLRVKNDEAKLMLGFSFNSGLLKAEVSEIKEGFKYDPIENIFITPTKALLLTKEIKKFKAYVAEGNIDPGKAFGVTTGMGEKVSYIGFHADKDGNTLITIGKIDGSGNITNSVTIPLNVEYNYAIEWDNIEAMSLTKTYYEGVELDQIYQLFDDFSKSMNGAYAYSVLDYGRFDITAIKNKMDPIYDKLGIERRTYTNNRSYGENSFLTNAGKTNSNSTSFDDIEAQLGDD